MLAQLDLGSFRQLGGVREHSYGSSEECNTFSARLKAHSEGLQVTQCGTCTMKASLWGGTGICFCEISFIMCLID